MSVRQIDITFGDVVYWPARRALEHGLNPDVEEVVENNKLGKTRECAENGHPKRCETSHGSWYCVLCTANCDRPSEKDAAGTFNRYGTAWTRNDFAVAEALK